MQAELFQVATTYSDLSVKDFPEYEDPTAAMVRSVKKYGILEPIIMRGNTLVAGRRRVQAAKLVGLATIPARIFPDDFSNAHILQLVENEQRHPNHRADFKAVEALLGEGKDEKTISEETGIPLPRLRQILQLRKLIPILRMAFEDGAIRHSVAALAAKKPAKLQERLVEVLENEGVLRLKDVHKVCKAERKAAVQALPDSLFGNVVPGWKTTTVQKLQEVRKQAEKDADTEWLEQLDSLIEELE